jgi:CBS domain-containing protein
VFQSGFSGTEKIAEGERSMKITKASEMMTSDVVTASPSMTITEVMEKILKHSISGLPVVDEGGALVGIISEIDLVNSMLSGNASDTLVAEVMSTSITSFPPDANCAEIADCFTSKRIRRVPIVDQGRLVGIVSRRDVLREMLANYDNIKSE